MEDIEFKMIKTIKRQGFNIEITNSSITNNTFFFKQRNNEIIIFDRKDIKNIINSLIEILEEKNEFFGGIKNGRTSN